MTVPTASARRGSGGPAADSAASSWAAVRLVAGREMRARLRSKAFVIQAVLLVVGVLTSIVVTDLIAGSGSRTPVAIASEAVRTDAGERLASDDGVEVTEVGTAAEAEDLVEDGDVDAALLPADGPTGAEVVFADAGSVSNTLLLGLSTAPEVRVLDGDSQEFGLLYIVALGFGLVFFMAAITFGSTIMQSVVEEKQTRVVEILMSAVSARVLLAGKIIGNSVMALVQIVAIAVAAALALAITGQNNLVTALGPSVLWFVLFFAIGFVLVAALFAATASLVSRQEDVGSVTTPVTMLVVAPYLLIVVFFDNDLVLRIMSYVPFSAPVGMPMRIFTDDAQWWEPLLSLVVIVVSTVLVVMLGARVYENSLLRTGARVKLRDALRG